MSKIKKYFYSIDTKRDQNIRIILLSDIHYFDKRDYGKLDIVLKEIRDLKPNYICIAGDLLDNAYINDEDIICNWLERLGHISKVIVSIGNHDLLVKENFEAGFNKKLFNKINNLNNVTVLNDNSVDIENICFLGITLPASYYYQDHEPQDFLINYINKTFPKVDIHKYNVLLCHSPLKICDKVVYEKIKIANKLDLILSGHTHGGITPEFLKPFLKGWGIISPFRKFFFKNAYGCIDLGYTKAVISGGITKASHRNKFHFLDGVLTREITVIDISSKDINAQFKGE